VDANRDPKLEFSTLFYEKVVTAVKEGSIVKVRWAVQDAPGSHVAC